MERVILVNAADMPIGTAEKLAAHRTGMLHRALSIFIVSPRGSMLLQRRAAEKYHSGGLWSNACCTHPRVDEDVVDAARRRLREELGLECRIARVLKFRYRARVSETYWEHEYDHVFVGICEEDPVVDRSEIEDWAWAERAELDDALVAQPRRFTPWMHLAHRRLLRRGLLDVAMIRRRLAHDGS